MKKKLLLGISMIGLVAAASVGTTLAVLSHQTEVTANTMTVGNVKIVQHEYERKDKSIHINSGAKEGELQEFQQNQVIMPSISKNGVSTDYTAEPAMPNLYCWGHYINMEDNIGCNGLWNPAKVENVVDKIVMVENTGNTDINFRTLIAFEKPDGIEYGEIPQGKDIMINSNLHWYDIKDIGIIEVNGTKYDLLSYTYDGNDGVLTAKEIARPSLLQLVLSPKMTSEDLEKFGEDGYKVLVLTQAVQDSDMLTPQEALNEAFGELTVEKNPFVK